MNTRTFARVLGAVYVVVGVLGFVPQLLGAPPAGAPPVTVDSAYGYLFNIFPVNAVHSLIHLAVGVAGLAAATSLYWSVRYARVLAVVFGALTIMGVIPRLNTVFGLTPLFGHDIWLHALTALVSAYFATRRETLVDAMRDQERGRRVA